MSGACRQRLRAQDGKESGEEPGGRNTDRDEPTRSPEHIPEDGPEQAWRSTIDDAHLPARLDLTSCLSSSPRQHTTGQATMSLLRSIRLASRTPISRPFSTTSPGLKKLSTDSSVASEQYPDAQHATRKTDTLDVQSSNSAQGRQYVYQSSSSLTPQGQISRHGRDCHAPGRRAGQQPDAQEGAPRVAGPVSRRTERARRQGGINRINRPQA